MILDSGNVHVDWEALPANPLWIWERAALSQMEVDEVSLAAVCGFGGVRGMEENVTSGNDAVYESSLFLDSWGLCINQSKINTHMGTVSMNCNLTTVSIFSPVPFNIVEMYQFELENKSVFVDEIQLSGYDGVHKSPEFSPLEFSQIEIKYSHFCLALRSQVSSICRTQAVCDIFCGRLSQCNDCVSIQGLSNQVFLTLVSLHSNLTGWSSDYAIYWAVTKESFLINTCPCFKPIVLQVRGILPHGLGYAAPGWSPTGKPEPYSYLSGFRKHSWMGWVFDESRVPSNFWFCGF